jgi:hypothetical protein
MCSKRPKSACEALGPTKRHEHYCEWSKSNSGSGPNRCRQAGAGTPAGPTALVKILTGADCGKTRSKKKCSSEFCSWRDEPRCEAKHPEDDDFCWAISEKSPCNKTKRKCSWRTASRCERKKSPPAPPVGRKAAKRLWPSGVVKDWNVDLDGEEPPHQAAAEHAGRHWPPGVVKDWNASNRKRAPRTAALARGLWPPGVKAYKDSVDRKRARVPAPPR